MMKDFGKRLAASRIAAGYAKGTHFAKDLGVAVERYRTYERGRSMPPPDILEMICDLTNKTTDFLILGRGPS